MDGPAMITQCALGVKQTQDYVFEAYPAGTHYWHAHGSLHIADGLSGPIVVRKKEAEPFVYDEERLFFLQDWYIQTSTQQLIGLTSYPFTWIGNPNSLLINGKGIAPECRPGGSNFNNSLVCLATCQEDPLTLLNVTSVEAGKTYRLRLINSAQLVMVNFAIANHSLTIVQVEGTNVDAFTVRSIDIAPGQRYDVLVTMDQTPGSYLIETKVRERNIPVLGHAILQYAESTLQMPQESPSHPDWNDTMYGIQRELALKTSNVADHPEAVALNATDITRYVLVGTQNRMYSRLEIIIVSLFAYSLSSRNPFFLSDLIISRTLCQ
jgi:L-ascorbate oxidase